MVKRIHSCTYQVWCHMIHFSTFRSPTCWPSNISGESPKCRPLCPNLVQILLNLCCSFRKPASNFLQAVVVHCWGEDHEPVPWHQRFTTGTGCVRFPLCSRFFKVLFLTFCYVITWYPGTASSCTSTMTPVFHYWYWMRPISAVLKVLFLTFCYVITLVPW